MQFDNGKKTINLSMRMILCACFLIPFIAFAKEKVAPSFSARDIKGNEVLSKNVYSKGPSVVFFGMTCACCEIKKDQIEVLKKLHGTYKSKGFEVIAVFSDGPSKAAQIKKVIEVNEFPFVSIIDDNDNLKNLFKPIELPTVYIINKEGNIVSSFRGFEKGDETKIEQTVTTLFQ